MPTQSAPAEGVSEKFTICQPFPAPTAMVVLASTVGAAPSAVHASMATVSLAAFAALAQKYPSYSFPASKNRPSLPSPRLATAARPPPPRKLSLSLLWP